MSEDNALFKPTTGEELFKRTDADNMIVQSGAVDEGVMPTKAELLMIAEKILDPREWLLVRKLFDPDLIDKADKLFDYFIAAGYQCDDKFKPYYVRQSAASERIKKIWRKLEKAGMRREWVPILMHGPSISRTVNKLSELMESESEKVQMKAVENALKLHRLTTPKPSGGTSININNTNAVQNQIKLDVDKLFKVD
jgi:hypothetical protein